MTNYDLLDKDEIISMQKEYMLKVKKYNEEKYINKAKSYVETFGCQMNARDSEKLNGILAEMGYEAVLKMEEADLVVFNTCCVRENAENRVYGQLGHLKALKKKKPNLKIVICGCMMQEKEVVETIKEKHRHVNLIFGTFNLFDFARLLYKQITSNKMLIELWDEHKEEIEDLPSIREYSFKSGVNIMYGCNNFCSYCIVPYVRGRERSRDVDEIIAELEQLVKDGVKEITLLGQNVNSYGNNSDIGINFPKLLEKVAKIENLDRIRFMTSHPKDLSDELIKVMQENDNILKHIHLPVQSGSSRILKKMNRKYSKEDYLNIVKKLRDAMPEIAITTDIIVGFPGETKEDFNETLDIVKKARYQAAFTYIYSKRIGTPAAEFDEQVSADEIKENFSELLDIINKISKEENEKMLGKTIKALVESESNEEGLLSARAENNATVHFKANESLIGEVCEIKLLENKGFYFMGELV